MRHAILFAALVLAGCGVDPGRNPDPVEVSGRVSLRGKPVGDVVLNLQATGEGVQAALPVTGGTFKGTVVPGTYTYYFTETKSPAGLKAIPEKYHRGSLDRQIKITGGEPLTLALE
jgi:hypothetical protein